jgi:hypothetical protein
MQSDEWRVHSGSAGGVSDQKFEIETIVSSPLDTSCELGNDIYNAKLTILAQFLCCFLSFDMDLKNAFSHLDLGKLDQHRMGNFRRCLETSV